MQEIKEINYIGTFFVSFSLLVEEEHAMLLYTVQFRDGPQEDFGTSCRYLCTGQCTMTSDSFV
jgi:hypothetical protein